ncbi:MAG: CotH kinase family protein [Phycisphaerae bacterium]|nr:CotH kinase family protein [Phycisphaerae bacterium]
MRVRAWVGVFCVAVVIVWATVPVCLQGSEATGTRLRSLPKQLNGLYITEFMAANRGALSDGDGRFSDWIEIYNAASAPVNLAGWHLTDNPEDLSRWTFPGSTELAARSYLLVFASGRNADGSAYVDATGHLHTNFRIDKDGGYLALVAPDGKTVVHAYEDYPLQARDVAYGLPQRVDSLVPAFTESAFHVPCAGDQGELWTDLEYADSFWTRGWTGIGFGTTSAVTAGLLARWPLDEGAGVIVGDEVSEYHGVLVGAPGPTWVQGHEDEGTALRFDGQTGNYVDFGNVDINIGSSFTLACWVNAPAAALGRYGVLLAKGPKNAGHYELYLNGSTGGGRTNGGAAMYVPDLGDFWSGYVVPDGTWHHLAWVYDGASVSFYADGQLCRTFRASGEVTPETAPLKIGALADGGLPFLGRLDDIRIHATALSPAQVQSLTDGRVADLKTDVAAEMLGVNSTLWMRLEFACSDPAAYDFLLLRLKYADGFVAYLNGAKVAQDSAPQDVTWCSAALTARSVASVETFAEFDLSASIHLLRPGKNVLALQALNDGSDDPVFLMLPMLIAGGDMARSEEKCYFVSPTPGWQNTTGYPALAQAPQFSTPSGTFTDSFLLELSVASPDAEIFYTVDGSESTQGSRKYIAPIPVSCSLEVRARTFEPNKVPSPVVSHVFLALDSDLTGFSSNLPIVLLDTWGRSIPGSASDSYAESRAILIDTGSGGRANVEDEINHAGRAGIRVRGRSSTRFPKNQYKFETWGDDNEDQNASLFGLPGESDWVLYGPYSDKTLMRNYLAYRWWGALGHYSVRTRFCEVFLNDDGDQMMSHADDYVGVYLLTEAIKIGPDRVDITELTPQDNAKPEITEGYIIEMGNANPSGFASYISGQTVQFNYWDPDARQLTTLQKQHVQDYIADFETALYGSDFDDRTNGYAAYTDVDSQVDYEIMREFTRNFDGGSTFFYLDRDGKLTMGPLWDYNMAMGNVDYAHNDEPGYYTTGWNDSYMAPGVNGWCPWWYRLRDDPDYQQRLIDRWFELRQGLLSDTSILAQIATAVALLEHEATARNFEKWHTLGSYVWANPPGWEDRRTYQSEVDWMRRWLLERAAWIDEQFVKPPQIILEEDLPAGKAIATLTRGDQRGEIYYTLDGSDPRIFGCPGQESILLVPEDAPKKVLVPTGSVDTSWRGDRAFDDCMWTDADYVVGGSGGVGYDESADFQPYISYDVSGLMNGDIEPGANTTCYVRIPFSVNPEDVGAFSALSLSVRFDDAFVAYLNGTEIARSENAPAELAWDSAAEQTLAESSAFVAYDVSAFMAELTSGRNILAVHGMNHPAEQLRFVDLGETGGLGCQWCL